MGETTTRTARGFRLLQVLCACVAGPLVILAALEVLLHIVGFGYPISCLLPRRCGAATYYVANPYFKVVPFRMGADAYESALEWDFDRAFDCLTEGEVAIPQEKPKGAYRIFVFGSSAAHGMPDRTFGSWRILEKMLAAQYPDTRFEIYCMALSAMNSHVMRLAAEACAPLHPDLYLVYMGNNEFIGPFGLGSIMFPRFSSSLWAIHTEIALKQLRLVQFFSLLLQSRDAPTWNSFVDLVAQINPFDPRLEELYGHFRANLDAICESAQRAGASIVLSAVGANLKDWGPFVSGHRPGLDANALAQWDTSYQMGVGAEAAGQYEPALTAYEQAVAIDPLYAELEFRMGRCWLQLGDRAKALQHYVAARDCDRVQVRANTRINEVIRTTAAAWEPYGCRLADPLGMLCDLSPNGVPGREFFYDFVHLTFEGDYVLACALLDAVVPLLPESVGKGSAAPVNRLSLEECRRRLGLSDPERCGQFLQSGNNVPGIKNVTVLERDDDLAWFDLQAKALIRKIEETRQDPAQLTLEGFREAVELSPEDRYLRAHYARSLLETGQPEKALEQAHIIAQQNPALVLPRVIEKAAREKMNQ